VRQILWDASALVKRYAIEVGTATVDALFADAAAEPHITTYLVYAEVCASLRRKRNAGFIDQAAFAAARSLLRAEVLDATGFLLMTIDDEAILLGIALSDQHNLNASDAAILAAYLRYARGLSPPQSPCLLVTADRRLLRAAAAEGLEVINPEQVQAGQVPALLSSP
jgi:predicted nucleic acid-binding protein